MIANIILYILIFIMGTVFGSFFTLAIYRIPKRQDIIHTHSYCPNCQHKLGILDLIPVFSYLFLGAKCRYCKEKIRPRYFILELTSGILFVALAYLLGVNVLSWNMHFIINCAFIALYLCFLFIMAGIDQENRQINKSVTGYGICIAILYIIYLCTVGMANIYRYVIYLVFYIIFLILDTITLKRFVKSSYAIGVMLTLITMSIFTGPFITLTTIIMTLIDVLIYIVIDKIKSHKKKNIKIERQIQKNRSIGFLLGVNNIICIISILIYDKLV